MPLRGADLDPFGDWVIIPLWLVRLADDTAIALYARLQEHGARRRYVRPSVSQLARETGHTRQTIYRAIRRLIAYGAIAERIRANGLAEWHCRIAAEAGS